MSETDSKLNKVLVIGAGELGMAVIRALAADRPREGTLSVLLRARRQDAQDSLVAALRDRGFGIVHADLATVTQDALAAILESFSTVICCTGFVGGPGTQRKITAAVLAAKVGRYVPWQFGVDYDVVGRGSGQEVWDEQLDVRDMLRSQTGTRWIVVSTGMFTSFLFERAFGVVDLEAGRVNALGSWANRLTVTIPDDVGRLTVAILDHVPPIENQVVHVAGDTLSYGQLADMIERHLGRVVERNLWTVEALRSEVVAHPDDGMRKYHLAFARADGVAWDKSMTFNAAQGIAVTDVHAWLASATSKERRSDDA